MVQVLTWPTTVLETGPVWAMMKNWEMLMSEAKAPDYGHVSSVLVQRVVGINHTIRIMTQRDTGS